MKHHLILIAALAAMALHAGAQTPEYTGDFRTKVKAFNHLDISLTSGTTGVGLDAAMPIGDKFRLRAGFAFMPHISKVLHFGVQVGEKAEGQTEEDFRKVSQNKFNRLSGLLSSFTGYQVDDKVDMLAIPTYYNFSVLADFYPLPRNKHWRVTAGIYIGNKQVGKSYNKTEDMPSLLAVGIYNNLYEKALAGEPLTTVGENDVYLPDEYAQKFIEYGKMSIRLGDYAHDIYYTENEYYTEDEWEEVDGEWVAHQKGDLKHAIGDVKYHAGEAYRMVPDENSMAKAWAYVNRLKPYVGLGYEGRLVKNDDRWHIGFDAGVLFWGGAPKVVTHDGTDLTRDVKNVRGKVGDYVDVIKKFEVFPVLNLRITRRIF